MALLDMKFRIPDSVIFMVHKKVELFEKEVCGEETAPQFFYNYGLFVRNSICGLSLGEMESGNIEDEWDDFLPSYYEILFKKMAPYVVKDLEIYCYFHSKLIVYKFIDDQIYESIAEWGDFSTPQKWNET